MNVCIFGWLYFLVFVAAQAFSLVVGSRGYSLLQCVGFSLQWLLLLQSMGAGARGLQGLRYMGSGVAAPGLQSTGLVTVAHGCRCSMACGLFPDQGLNPCLPHWQADALSLSHKGSPKSSFLRTWGFFRIRRNLLAFSGLHGKPPEAFAYHRNCHQLHDFSWSPAVGFMQMICL